MLEASWFAEKLGGQGAGLKYLCGDVEVRERPRKFLFMLSHKPVSGDFTLYHSLYAATALRHGAQPA